MKAYITKYIQKEQQEIVQVCQSLYLRLSLQDTQQSRTHEADAKNDLAEIRELNTQYHFLGFSCIVGLYFRPKRFQHKNCSRCHQSLDLPVFHFLCNHSYHQRCLGENESVCPKCADEYGLVQSVLMTHERNTEFRTKQKLLDENSRKHGEFFKMVHFLEVFVVLTFLVAREQR